MRLPFWLCDTAVDLDGGFCLLEQDYDPSHFLPGLNHEIDLTFGISHKKLDG